MLEAIEGGAHPNRLLGTASRELAVPGRNVEYWVAPAEPAEAAPDLSLNLREYWRIILKHRWVIAIVAASALALGGAATLLMTPIYTAAATVQIDRESARIVAGQDVQPQEQMIAGEEFFQTQYGLLRSRSLSIRVMEALGLARSEQFAKLMGAEVPEDATPTTRRNQVINLLQQNLNVDPVRGSRLVKVSFASPQPELSATVANAFAENFIGANLDRRFESSSYARDFLETRLKQAKARLEETERQLVAYATSQQIINLRDEGSGDSGSQSLAAADLAALNASLATAKSNRIAAEERWRQAQRTSAFGGTEVMTSPTVQQLSQARARLAAEYQEKLRVYKPDFPVMQQLQAQLEETDRQLQAETQNIRSSVQQDTRADARAAYNIALNEERALARRVEQLKSSVLNLRGRSIQYNILQREVDTNRTLYDGLLQRYKEVGVAGGVTTNNISIVDRAEPPAMPSEPQPLLNMAVALVLGLGLGVLIAFILEALDQAIRTPADVETKLGLPLLGTIPKLKKGVTPQEAMTDVRSPMSEAYFSLRANLQFSTKDGVPRTLLVTSSRPGEGKSTTSQAIAASFARLGMRTLIVDADLRNPSLHKGLGMENQRGLSSLLTGGAPMAEVLQSTDTPNLTAMTSGPLPPSPAELLAGGRLRAFLGEAQREFDLVVVDGPPVMGLADAPMISTLVDGTLLVVEAGVVGRNQAKSAAQRLRTARASLVGVVMTKFDVKQASYGYGYAYEYDYTYGSKSTELRKA